MTVFIIASLRRLWQRFAWPRGFQESLRNLTDPFSMVGYDMPDKWPPCLIYNFTYKWGRGVCLVDGCYVFVFETGSYALQAGLRSVYTTQAGWPYPLTFLSAASKECWHSEYVCGAEVAWGITHTGQTCYPLNGIPSPKRCLFCQLSVPRSPQQISPQVMLERTGSCATMVINRLPWLSSLTLPGGTGNVCQQDAGRNWYQVGSQQTESARAFLLYSDLSQASKPWQTILPQIITILFKHGLQPGGHVLWEISW